MSRAQLEELVKSLSAYLVCLDPTLAIVDRPSLEEGISFLRSLLEKVE